MTELRGVLIETDQLTAQDREIMFALMSEAYDQVSPAGFLRDLAEKETCILLHDIAGTIRGFTTQKLMSVEISGQRVEGIFSGDTIIDRAHWGSIELYRVFATSFIGRESPYSGRYWFLISKGYKTYKMLPLFFEDFYPNRRRTTPDYEQRLMMAYARARYHEEYDATSGVVAYRGEKDRLKPGVADITDRQLRDPDIRHFQKLNPGHVRGHDLVCLAELTEENLRPSFRRLLLGR